MKVVIVFALMACSFTWAKGGHGNGAKGGHGNGAKGGHGYTRDKYNVVFLLADDLGFNDIGYNNCEVKTPNLNALKRKGVHLKNMYVNNACSPTRHSTLTGRHPYKTSMGHIVVLLNQPNCSPTDIPLMSDRFHELGYETYHAGKWHIGFCQEKCLPLNRGFDHTYGYYQGAQGYYNHRFGPPVFSGYDFQNQSAVDLSVNGSWTTDILGDYLSDEFTDYKDKYGDKPFFLYLALPHPHDPLDTAPEYLAQYKDLFKENENRAKYFGLVTAMDDLVGDFIKLLKKEKLWKNTIFVFSSDNGGQHGGWANNLPYRGAKGSLFEGGVRAEAFITAHWLGIEKKAVDGLMHAVDWSPTLMDLVGGEPDSNYDGVSQYDMIINDGPSARQDEPLILNIDMDPWSLTGQSAVRKGDYKLIWGFYGFTDGYGLNASLTYCLDKNLALVGKTIDEVPACANGITGPARFDPAARVIQIEIAQAMAFDPNDLSSGMVHFYNIANDEAETTNLADDPDYADLIFEYKLYIIDALADYRPPSSTEQLPAAHPDNFDGIWSTGWCSEYELDLGQ